MALKTKVLVKTLSGTAAETLGTGLIPSDSLIQADTGDTVHIGLGGVTSSTGFLVPTTPIKFGSLVTSGHTNHLDLAHCWIVGASGDVVRILYLAEV